MSTPNASIEYELTFLAKHVPNEIHNTLPERMVDIYLPENVEIHPVLRLRKRAGNYEITKKTILNGTDSSEMREQTIPLTQLEFEELASGHHRLVEKDRYKVMLGGRPAEVDIFSGKLEGLVLIDFEFLNSVDKAAFQPPDCCLAEVTQEVAVAGGHLAGKSYDDIDEILQRFQYRRLFL